MEMSNGCWRQFWEQELSVLAAAEALKITG
jgi:hypothetical protein